MRKIRVKMIGLEEKQCPFCKGTGKLYLGAVMYKCPACNGKSEIEKERYNLRGKEKIEKEKDNEGEEEIIRILEEIRDTFEDGSKYNGTDIRAFFDEVIAEARKDASDESKKEVKLPEMGEHDE